jgi:hypothetical protein
MQSTKVTIQPDKIKIKCSSEHYIQVFKENEPVDKIPDWKICMIIDIKYQYIHKNEYEYMPKIEYYNIDNIIPNTNDENTNNDNSCIINNKEEPATEIITTEVVQTESVTKKPFLNAMITNEEPLDTSQSKNVIDKSINNKNSFQVNIYFKESDFLSTDNNNITIADINEHLKTATRDKTKSDNELNIGTCTNILKGLERVEHDFMNFYI